MATDPSNPAAEPGRLSPAQEENTASLNQKAERCRRLAAGISDKQAAEVLRGMAKNYQEAADRMNSGD